MNELIKKVTEAFVEYLLGSLVFQEKVEAIVESKMATLTAVDEDRVNELITDKLADYEEDSDQKIRDVVRNMDFSIEIGGTDHGSSS